MVGNMGTYYIYIYLLWEQNSRNCGINLGWPCWREVLKCRKLKGVCCSYSASSKLMFVKHTDKTNNCTVLQTFNSAKVGEISTVYFINQQYQCCSLSDCIALLTSSCIHTKVFFCVSCQILKLWWKESGWLVLPRTSCSSCSEWW
jgi:hypothetical protein